MRSTAHLAVLTLLTLMGSLSAEDTTPPPAIPGTYTGSYTWLDMPADTVGDRTMTLVISEEGGALKASFTANFHAKSFAKEFQKPKQYTYTGTLAPTNKDGKNPGKFRVLTGVITADAGKQKQSWNVRVKLTPQGRCFGIAEETEPGYGSWGTFDLQAATP